MEKKEAEEKIRIALLVDGILPHVMAKHAKETNVCNSSMFSLYQSHGIIDISDL